MKQPNSNGFMLYDDVDHEYVGQAYRGTANDWTLIARFPERGEDLRVASADEAERLAIVRYRRKKAAGTWKD